MSSILTTVKKNLGLDESYTAFDTDIVIYINSVLSTVTQLGVGPENGFQIADSTATWESLLGTNPRLNSVKTFVYLKVRLLFDPPANSFGIAAIEKMIEEETWRINVQHEYETWAPTNPDVPDDAILDGGTP